MFWLALATIHAIAGIWAWLAILTAEISPPYASGLPPVLHAALLAVFAGSGLALVVAGPRDPRAKALGTVLALFGSLFAQPLLAGAAEVHEAAAAIAPVLLAVQPATLMPAFFWQFAWIFPRPQPALVPLGVARIAGPAITTAGVVLFTAILVVRAGAALRPGAVPAGGLQYLWPVLVLLLLPGIALLIAKLRTALPEERRRVRLFIAGLLAGIAPLALDVLLASFSQTYYEYLSAPGRREVAAAVVTGALLLVPLTTAYAVLIERLLETRLMVRLALQYALARYFVLAVMAVPGVLLVTYFYTQRERPLGDILASKPPLVWIAALGAGAILIRTRRPIMQAIDRRYFREQHDAREILVNLTDSTRRAVSVGQVASMVEVEVDRALHLDGVVLLVRQGDRFVAPSGWLGALPVHSPLAALVGGATTPLDVDPHETDSALDRLPAADREWLADARPRLLVPLIGSGGDLVGLLALGGKRSETPYSGEDRLLLKAVAASAAAAVEQQLRSSSGRTEAAVTVAAEPGTDAPPSQPALECRRCDLVFAAGTAGCSACGSPLFEAALPCVLAGKFTIERRLGSGGMGVVYLGTDRALHRQVAIKTLPRLTPSESRRLRREARALASLEHEHLELIYAVESWRDAPVLVLEYLAGGTLAQRLQRGPLPPQAVVTLGLDLAGALYGLHRAGVLHRDVKPSNIGFTARQTPKLLDFGLATAPADVLESGPWQPPPVALDSSTRSSPLERLARLDSTTHGPAGTLGYMSPEALAGEPVDVMFDLWSLAVTLCESLTGSHPFLTADRFETVRRISLGLQESGLAGAQASPPALRLFFLDALHADRERRPRTAREFGARLAECAAPAGT